MCADVLTAYMLQHTFITSPVYSNYQGIYFLQLLGNYDVIYEVITRNSGPPSPIMEVCMTHMLQDIISTSISIHFSIQFSFKYRMACFVSHMEWHLVDKVC